MKSSRILIILSVFILFGLYSAPGVLQAQTFTGPELLGRPTANSVTVHVVIDSAREIYFQYDTSSGSYTGETGVYTTVANEPMTVTLSGLTANTKYYYRMGHRAVGDSTWTYRTEHSFYTQRAKGSTFSFTISSDGHVNILLGNDTQWQTTLTNVATDVSNGLSDFHIDLGDSVAMDNGNTTNGSVTTSSAARTVYLYARNANRFGRFSHSAPIFLLPGNHEQTEGWHLDDKGIGNEANSLPAWSINARKRYFLDPVPDAFYSGNTETFSYIDGDHMLSNYYAWNWGDALFIVLDPFWYATTKAKNDPSTYGGGEDSEAGSGDRWDWTLGDTQYNWLKTTLENSNAKYKFVLMHHMTGGTDDYIREGAYAAPYCEWGGYNEDGTTYAFGTRGPTWDTPIHQVLVDNNVSAIFHGHDHQYAYEIREGVVYQSVPAAGFTGNGFNLYSESDALTERVLPSSGHLRVTVAPEQATVNYIRSGGTGGTHSYTIAPAPVSTCQGDLDADGDVDGKDVSLLIPDISQIDIGIFAGNFGKTTCP
jgi:hypothetical protein